MRDWCSGCNEWCYVDRPCECCEPTTPIYEWLLAEARAWADVLAKSLNVAGELLAVGIQPTEPPPVVRLPWENTDE